MLTFFSIYRLEKFHLWHREKGHGAMYYGAPWHTGLQCRDRLGGVGSRAFPCVCAELRYGRTIVNKTNFSY